MIDNRLLLVAIAVFVPPLAVGLKRGVGLALAVNLALCLMFLIPGMLHAVWVATQ